MTDDGHAIRRSVREDDEVEALRTDRYLDALLAAADRRADDAPTSAELDPSVRRAIRRLRRDLVRVHPSFRFEERLAARLASAADRVETGTEGGGSGEQVREIAFEETGWDQAADPAEEARRLSGLVRRRPLLIGGAMASAAVSLAGAAFVVARRRSRPRPTMEWAVRAAHGMAPRSARARARRPRRARRVPLA